MGILVRTHGCKGVKREMKGAGMSLITVSDIKLPIDKDEKELIRIAEKRLGCKVGYFAIKKKSLDARDKSNVRYVYTIEFAGIEKGLNPSRTLLYGCAALDDERKNPSVQQTNRRK